MASIGQGSTYQNGQKGIPVQETVYHTAYQKNANCTAQVQLGTVLHDQNNLNTNNGTTERVSPVVEQMSPS